MSTGAPIYLVSACTSAEDFVAAFRRYAERTGLFVPIAEPLPAGRTAHFAVTLVDGGVMIDGEAQIVQSWPKGGGLHGRPGMTLKFLVLDDASKTTLAELEKARLAMKPLPPSVPPRPANVPPEPRPTPAPIGGRVDAITSRAQCIAIGDTTLLRDGAGSGATHASSDAGPSRPNKISAKLAISSVPNLGRPKTPSAPPGNAVAPEAPASAAAEKPTAVGPPPLAPSAAAEPPTAVGPPPAASTKASPQAADAPPPTAPAAPVRSAATSARAAKPATSATATSNANPTASSNATPTASSSATPAASSSATPASPTKDSASKSKKLTSIGFPLVERSSAKADSRATALGVAPLKVTQTQPLPLAPPPKSGPLANDSGSLLTSPTPTVEPAPTSKSSSGSRRSRVPAAPPAGPRNPTPAAPLPLVRSRAMNPAPATADHDGERTDLNARLVSDPNAETSDVIALDAPTVGRDKVAARPPAPPLAKRAGGMRASEILAAIPNEDWTMTPDAAGPTVLPPSPDEAPTVAPPIIQPESARTGASGNPVTAVASKKAIQVQQWEDKPTGIGEPLVQVDSTLMEPLDSIALDDPALEPGQAPFYPTPPPLAPPPGAGPYAFSAIAQSPPLAIPTPVPMAPGYAPPGYGGSPEYGAPMFGRPTPMPGMPQAPFGAPMQPGPTPMAYPPQRMVTDAGTGFFRDSAAMLQYPQDEVYGVDTRHRKRLLIIAVSATVALATILAIVLVVGGHKSTAAVAGTQPGSATGGSAATATPPAAAPAAGGSSGSEPNPQAMVERPGSGSTTTDQPPGADAALAPSTCSVDLTTTPPGAQVAREDNTALGTTPGTFEVPCGTKTKLVIHKQGFFSTTKPVSAAEPHVALSVALSRMQLSLKVTSIPAGATITVGGKTLGITPTTIKLPAYQPTAITLTKDGFAPDTQRLTVKQNNMAHFVTLKQQAKPPHH